MEIQMTAEMLAALNKEPWRCHVTYPGRLEETVRRRIAELGSRTFSRYVVELACYNLRRLRPHSFTGRIGRLPSAAQDAIDRAIHANYREGIRCNGHLIEAVLMGAIKSIPPEAWGEDGEISNVSDFVLFPGAQEENLKEWINILGFKGPSEFVTSLIRFDLLIGGPHKECGGDDCDAEMIASLDVETIRAYRSKIRAKTLTDFIVERIAGRVMTDEERDSVLEQAAEHFKEYVLKMARENRREKGEK